MYQFDTSISSAVEVDGAAPPPPAEEPARGPLPAELLDRMQRYWQAATYLTIGQINGYKIGGPTVLGRSSDENVRALIEGNGHEAHFVEADDPPRAHQQSLIQKALAYSHEHFEDLPEIREWTWTRP
jgi:phosphoketolase